MCARLLLSRERLRALSERLSSGDIREVAVMCTQVTVTPARRSARRGWCCGLMVAAAGTWVQSVSAAFGIANRHVATLPLIRSARTGTIQV